MSDILQREISKIVSNIVNVVTIESELIDIQRKQVDLMPNSLEKMARTTELKIQRIQINKLKKRIYAILKASENLIVMSTIEVLDN